MFSRYIFYILILLIGMDIGADLLYQSTRQSKLYLRKQHWFQNSHRDGK